APQREPSRQVLLRALAPGASSETVILPDSPSESADCNDLVATATKLVENGDDCVGVHSDGVMKAEGANLLPKFARAAVGGVRENHTPRDVICDSAPDHVERELR